MIQFSMNLRIYFFCSHCTVNQELSRETEQSVHIHYLIPNIDYHYTFLPSN